MKTRCLFSVALILVLMTGCLPAGTGSGEKQNASNEVRFVVFGDSQFANQGVFERMVHEVEMLRPYFVIQVGDLIHGYTHDEKTLREEWKRFQKQIDPLTMDFYPVPGNHDAVTPEAEKVYGEYWGKDKYYYSFDYGPVHCIVLDSWWEEEDDRVSEWQQKWLLEDLEKYAEKNGGKNSRKLAEKSIFVFLHSPLWRYAKDTPGRADWEKVHEILRKYPVQLVVAGHTHEYVWENRDGIDYLVINSSGNQRDLERGGFFHAFLHVSVLPGGDIHYATIKAGSILPIDTVDSTDRGTVPGFALSGGAIRVPEWKEGKKLDTSIQLPVKNRLEEKRLFRLDWHVPFGADVKIDPPGMWIETDPGEKREVSFHITSDAAPGEDRMPWLEMSTEKTIRTGVVSRDWEKRYRGEKSGSEFPHFDLEAPVTFEARYQLFVPPIARALQRKGTIDLDGRIDEEAWNTAPVVDRFLNKEGSKPECNMKVRILYDDEFLYVAGWMEEPHPDQLTTNAEPPIALTWSDDDFELFFDPGKTQSNYVRLFQNAAGTRFNSLPRNVPDRYFKSRYVSGIEIGDDYWSIEMKIPWSDIAVADPPKKGDEWGFNIGRHRQKSSVKESQWSGGLYSPSRYGLLKFE